MGVHPDGSGTEWTLIEAVDVDQPHGKDYLYGQHIAKGVRKRMNQEHSAFGDTTAGGIHKPGGAAILAVEYTDDCTVAVVADGTYRARGLIWSYSKDTSNYGVLFCNTSAAGVSTCGDFTVLKMHPDLQWAGGDVTWAGAHEFDSSVDITGPLGVDSSADVSDVYVDGDISVKGSAKIATDLTVTGDIAVDGTSNFTGDVAFAADVSIDGTTALQNTVIEGDSTFTFAAIAGETGPIFKVFGDWSTRAVNTEYQARTDGFVAVRSSAQSPNFQILTDGASPATAVIAKVRDDDGNTYDSMPVPVKAADYWCVSSTGGTLVVRWLPIGDNT